MNLISGAPLKCMLLTLPPSQTTLYRDKNSSLLRALINYGLKRFYNIGPRMERLAGTNTLAYLAPCKWRGNDRHLVQGRGHADDRHQDAGRSQVDDVHVARAAVGRSGWNKKKMTAHFAFLQHL